MQITGCLDLGGWRDREWCPRASRSAAARSLGFSPKLKISLTGKGKTRSGDHPTLTANLTPAVGAGEHQLRQGDAAAVAGA